MSTCDQLHVKNIMQYTQQVSHISMVTDGWEAFVLKDAYVRLVFSSGTQVQ